MLHLRARVALAMTTGLIAACAVTGVASADVSSTGARSGQGFGKSPLARAHVTSDKRRTFRQSDPTTRHLPVLGDGNQTPPGFPDSLTTGVPAGTSLRVHHGDLVVREAGTVVDALDIRGCVTVRASHVTIKRSRITCGGSASTPFPLRVIDGFTDLSVEDVEVDGMGAARVAVIGGHYRLSRVNVHSAVDGVRMGDRSQLLDSYVHDLARLPETHNDTVQTLGGRDILVRGSTLLAYNQRTDDPMNGTIQTGRLHSPLVNMVVEGNFLDGGSYAVRGASHERDAALAISQTFRRNVFGPNCGFAAAAYVAAPVVEWADNIWAAGGPVSRDAQVTRHGCLKRERSRTLG